MKYPAGFLGLLVLCLPLAGQEKAAPTAKTVSPEAMMPAKSLFYFRFDGLEPHRKAFNKTVMGKLMRDELGDFVNELGKVVKKLMDEQAALGLPLTEESKKTLKDLKNLERFLGYFWQSGFAVSVEVINQKRAQATVVFPDGARKKNWLVLHKLIKSIATADGSKVKVLKLRGRTIYQVEPLTGEKAYGPVADGARPARYTIPQQPVWGVAQPMATLYRTTAPFRVPANPVVPLHGEKPLRIPCDDAPPPTPAKKDKKAKPKAVPPVPPPPLPGKEKQKEKEKPKETHETTISWWKEGKHIVVVAGTEPVARTLDIIEGKQPNLTSHPQFKKLHGFKSYETHSRGFIDIQPIVELVIDTIKDQSKLNTLAQKMLVRMVLQQVGVSGVKALSWHWGYEDQYLRTTFLLHVHKRESRRGLLRLVSSPIPSNLKKLPPLPPDTPSVSIHHFDWQRIYKEVRQWYQTYQLAERISEGKSIIGGYNDLDAEIKKAIGIDLQKDLLAALHPTFVSYQANSEGLLFLGRSIAIKVKDAKKLDQTLAKLCKKLDKAVQNNGSGVTLQKRNYRGATIHVLHFKDGVLAPSWTINKGWFVVGLMPQNVQAYVWRSRKLGKVWQAPPVARLAIQRGLKNGNARTKLGYLTIYDPRPTVKFLMPFVPLLFEAMNGAEATGKKPLFDITTIPHARALTEQLSPNASAFFDDDDALRWETHCTMELPAFWEFYMLIAVAGGMDAMPLPLQPRWGVPGVGGGVNPLVLPVGQTAEPEFILPPGVIGALTGAYEESTLEPANSSPTTSAPNVRLLPPVPASAARK